MKNNASHSSNKTNLSMNQKVKEDLPELNIYLKDISMKSMADLTFS
jgi:hypothetical protein